MYSSQSSENIKSYKIVVLGQTAVGKSSIVSRYIHDKFDEFQESTIGAAFFCKTILANSFCIFFFANLFLQNNFCKTSFANNFFQIYFCNFLVQRLFSFSFANIL